MLFESCDGLFSCVEASSNTFDSDVENFVSFLVFRVGKNSDLANDSRSVEYVVPCTCTISSGGCIVSVLIAVPGF